MKPEAGHKAMMRCPPDVETGSGGHSLSNPVNVMIDIEALGTSPGCAVIEIGMVVFQDPVYPIFSRVIHVELQSQIDVGLVIEPETMIWWMKQPREVRQVIWEPNKGSIVVHFHNAIAAINMTAVDWSTALVWAKGPTYDLAILHAFFKAGGKRAPWKYQNERCVRTATMGVPKPDFTGIKHRAFDDALHQVKHLAVAGLPRENMNQEVGGEHL